MFDRERLIQLFLIGSLALMTYEVYLILRPFLVPIVWAMLLAFIFHPLMIQARRLLRHKTLAALAISILVALVAIVPALWLFTVLAAEISNLATQAQHLMAPGGVAKATQWIGRSRLGMEAQRLLLRIGIQPERDLPYYALQVSRYASQTLVEYISGIFKNLLAFGLDFSLTLLILFYMLRDGEGYYQACRDFTPLHEEDKRAVFDTLRVTLSAVMRGLMLTALLQGLVVGLGLFVTGVPYWVALSILTAVVGLLPFGGTALVWMPASLYLLQTRGWGHAAALFIWSLLAVTLIDNVLKPALTGRGTGLPTLALFLGIAGGLEAYGLPGIFAGPAVIAVMASLMRAYNKSYQSPASEAA